MAVDFLRLIHTTWIKEDKEIYLMIFLTYLWLNPGRDGYVIYIIFADNIYQAAV